MKKIIILSIILSSVLYGTRALSIEDAIRLSLKENHDIKSKLYKTKQLKLEKKEAFSQYLPRVNATASIIHLNDPIELNLDPLRDLLIGLETKGTLADINLQTIITRGTALTEAEKMAYTASIKAGWESAIPTLNMQVLDQNITRMTIDFLQPIWMGGRLRALNRGANLKHLSGETDLLLTREKIMEETVRIYFLNKLLAETRNIYAEVEKGVAGHVKRAESLYRSGLIAKYQLIRAKVAHTDAVEKRMDAEADLKTLDLILKNLLNIKSSEKIMLSTPIPYMSMKKDSNKWKRAIIEKNGILEKIRLGQKLAQQKLKGDLGKYLPQVFAFGSYEVLKNDLSVLDPRWKVGIGVKLNLFSGGEKFYQLKKNKLLKKEILETEKNVSSMLEKLGDKLYFSAVKENNKLKNYDVRRQEVDENLTLAKSRFSSGLGISLEVIDAHLLKQKIEINNLASRYKYLSYQLKLNELSMNLENYIKKMEEQK